MSIRTLLGSADFLPYKYVLDHGHEVRCRAEKVGAARARGCHSNARQLATRWPQRYTWWTGYALDALGGVVAHSWVEREGEHLEVTWDEPGADYIGVPVVGGANWWDGGGHPIENIAWNSL